MYKIKLFQPDYDETDRAAIIEVLDSGWLSMGEKTKLFEEKFSQYLGNQVKSLTVSNCTAALHIALLTAGIGPGDEVIIPASTFIADLNVVAMVGATPVIVDASSLDDWNMSAYGVRAKCNSKTRAIIALHFGGYPFDLEIASVAKEKNIVLIEDVAHAIGAITNGKACGTIGDMAAFSFFANKNLAVGEGGMFVSSNPDFLNKARLLRSHGMTTLSFDRFEGRSISYDVLQPGLNYRMPEFGAALGLTQLEKLNENNKKRKALVEYYHTLLTPFPLIIPFKKEKINVQPSYHIYPVLLPPDINRNSFIEHMKKEKIQTSIHYPSFKQFTYYKNILSEPTETSDEISRRVVTLPLYPSMLLSDIEYVVNAIKKFFQGADIK